MMGVAQQRASQRQTMSVQVRQLDSVKSSSAYHCQSGVLRRLCHPCTLCVWESVRCILRVHSWWSWQCIEQFEYKVKWCHAINVHRQCISDSLSTRPSDTVTNTPNQPHAPQPPPPHPQTTTPNQPSGPGRHVTMSNFGIGVIIGVAVTLAVVIFFTLTVTSRKRRRRRHLEQHQQQGVTGLQGQHNVNYVDGDGLQDSPPNYIEVVANPDKYPLKVIHSGSTSSDCDTCIGNLSTHLWRTVQSYMQLIVRPVKLVLRILP